MPRRRSRSMQQLEEGKAVRDDDYRQKNTEVVERGDVLVDDRDSEKQRVEALEPANLRRL